MTPSSPTMDDGASFDCAPVASAGKIDAPSGASG
jgi:hypothetical protein